MFPLQNSCPVHFHARTPHLACMYLSPGWPPGPGHGLPVAPHGGMAPEMFSLHIENLCQLVSEWSDKRSNYRRWLWDLEDSLKDGLHQGKLKYRLELTKNERNGLNRGREGGGVGRKDSSRNKVLLKHGVTDPACKTGKNIHRFYSKKSEQRSNRV